MASKLLIHPEPQAGDYIRITAATAGWEHLHFAARRMQIGQRWEHHTNETELVIVVLGGVCRVAWQKGSHQGEWAKVGRRADVFSGMPYAMYLSRHTDFTLEALGDGLDLAYGWCATDEDHPAALVTPDQVTIEIRGGANATRQINGILPPGFDCQRLVAVEVYTPPGNWSSYPPHKHDVHRVAADGTLLEADLEEVYFYKLDRPEGYAIQRVYTADGRLDETLLARNNEAVLVPEGYHPVVSAHGYTTYYLNFLAGSAQSLANSDDPQHAWIKDTWDWKDPRLPLVSMEMERA